MKNSQKVLIVGSGGREHALAWKLAQSKRIAKLYIAPGNAGTAELAENVPIQATDIPALVEFAKGCDIDLVVIGPDNPLADGLVDALSDAGIAAFGPTKGAAQIESSKAFAKDLMHTSGVPTASFQVFNDYKDALEYVRSAKLPIVIKASGLAFGKGVYICKALSEGEGALQEIMVDSRFGSSGDSVVIEEYLEGEEVSVHAICDGKQFVLMPIAQDYKQIGEGDTGSNTGGIGAIAPVPWVDPKLIQDIKDQIIQPTLERMDADGKTFKGLLYPGLMVTNGQPNVIEYNARFGDPEAQVYMRLLKSDLLDLLEASVNGGIDKVEPQWYEGFAACVVLTAGGYPGEYHKDDKITGIEEATAIEGVEIFHAGTKNSGAGFVTDGGRVLSVTAKGETLQQALDRAYAAVDLIHFDHMYYRRDIGFRVNKKAA